MRTFTFVLTALLLAPSTYLAGQRPPVEPGARVRVTAPDCGLDHRAGTLQPSRADTLVLGYGFSTAHCLWLSVTRLDVSQGRKSNVGEGIGYGALVGGMVGLIVFSIDQATCTSWCMGGESLAFIAAIIFAVPGAFVGGIVGASVKTDRWEEVPLDRLRVSFSPRRDGRFAVGLSLSF